MTHSTIKTAFAFLKTMPLKDIIFIGGEPLIHPNFIEFIELVRNSGFNAFVITNSIEFKNRNFLDQALNAGIKGITTSLKASSRDSYLQNTGRDVFDDLLQAIWNINDSNVYHKISITVSRALFETFDELLELVINLGVKELAFDMERPILLNAKPIQSEEITPRELATFFETIYPKLESSGLDYTLKISLPFCLFSNL